MRRSLIAAFVVVLLVSTANASGNKLADIPETDNKDAKSVNYKNSFQEFAKKLTTAVKTNDEKYVFQHIKLPITEEIVELCDYNPDDPSIEDKRDKKYLQKTIKYYDGMTPDEDYVSPEKAKKVYKYKNWQKILSCWFTPSLPLCKYITPINEWNTVFDSETQAVLTKKSYGEGKWSGALVPRLFFKYINGDWMLVKYSAWSDRYCD